VVQQLAVEVEVAEVKLVLMQMVFPAVRVVVDVIMEEVE
jgi:hypothetical protein